MKTGCAILAGGKNSRMDGRDKAFIRIEGIPIIHRILKIVLPLFEEINVISNTPELYNGISGIQVFPDMIPDKGPLGGIYTALSKSVSEGVFILACDMPFPSPAVIRDLLLKFEQHPDSIIVPRQRRLIEPLFAVYPKNLWEPLYHFLISPPSLAIYRFIQESPHLFLDLPVSGEIIQSFRNINVAEDIPQTKNHQFRNNIL